MPDFLCLARAQTLSGITVGGSTERGGSQAHWKKEAGTHCFKSGWILFRLWKHLLSKRCSTEFNSAPPSQDPAESGEADVVRSCANGRDPLRGAAAIKERKLLND